MKHFTQRKRKKVEGLASYEQHLTQTGTERFVR